MFDPQSYYLFGREELPALFTGWALLDTVYQSFAAPHGQTKSFVTLVARKPLA